jgi:hypothetical protein
VPNVKTTPALAVSALLGVQVVGGDTRRAHRRQVLHYQHALLETILRQGSATADDAAPDLAAKYADGGRWAGPATLKLARAGLISRVEAAHSRRKARHAGLLWRWRAADKEQLVRALGLLRRRLADLGGPVAEPEQRTLFE